MVSHSLSKSRNHYHSHSIHSHRHNIIGSCMILCWPTELSHQPVESSTNAITCSLAVISLKGVSTQQYITWAETMVMPSIVEVQGNSVDKAVIYLGGDISDHEQAHGALSRVRTMEGVLLIDLIRFSRRRAVRMMSIYAYLHAWLIVLFLAVV